MKITCLKQELNNALAIVSKALASKPQVPILSGVYLKTEEDKLTIEATNYELGIIAKIPVDIEEPGETVLPGRYLQEFTRRLPGEQVSLTSDSAQNTMQIQSDATTYNLRTMDPAEYPVIRPLDSTLSFTIKDNILRTLIKKTVFSCATDESRPVFTGVYLNIEDNVLTMAATNTHRLAVRKQTFDQSIGNIKLIIPAKALSELQHTLTSNVPSDVKVTCSLNQISFAFENLYLTSRLIEGAFPDYRRVIPQKQDTKVTLQTADFNAAMDRVSLISRMNDYNVVKLSFHENQLCISSDNPEIGHAEETIGAQLEGPDIDIAFNATYLVDSLKAIESEECVLSLRQPLNPVKITEPDDPDFTYVVTPVRVQH